MVHLIAVDCGRSNVKGVGESGVRESFPAHVKPYRRLNLDRRMGKNDLVVDYRDERWFVGDIAKDESGGEGSQMMLSTKAHADTRILALTMLHRLVPDGSGVFLVTGAPVESYKMERVALKEMLSGEHTITVNAETKKFYVGRVEVGTECATAAWAMKRPGTYTVVDPGSRTVNYATIRNGRWWDEKSGTLNYGTESVDVGRSQFARMMVADLSRRLRQLEPVVLIGGNAEALLPLVTPYHAQTEAHDDALFANANAFYEIGVAALDKAKRA